MHATAMATADRMMLAIATPDTVVLIAVLVSAHMHSHLLMPLGAI